MCRRPRRGERGGGQSIDSGIAQLHFPRASLSPSHDTPFIYGDLYWDFVSFVSGLFAHARSD
jgi:hypothetical protein